MDQAQPSSGVHHKLPFGISSKFPCDKEEGGDAGQIFLDIVCHQSSEADQLRLDN